MAASNTVYVLEYIIGQSDEENAESSGTEDSCDSALSDSEFYEQKMDSHFDPAQTSSDTEWKPEQTPGKRIRTSGPSSTPSSTPGPSGVEHSDFTPKKAGRSSKGRRQGPLSAAASLSAWQDTTVEDIKPSNPPFKPIRTPGPQVITTATYTPLQLFQLFFSSEVMNTLLRNTNAYGAMRQPGDQAWTDLLLEDLYALIAIVIFMGLFKCPALNDYWRRSPIIGKLLPSQIMSRAKFYKILSTLHLSDPKVEAENEKKKGTKDYDRLCKIQPMYNQIVDACKANFHPFQSIAVDERMVKSKARNVLRQYMKNKPTKLGYKLFVLADSSCGYTWNFFVYEGKAVVEQGKGLSYDSVMKLVEVKVLGTGYKLFVDNFYTSPILFKDLLKQKILACGTVRSNAPGFPNTEANTMPVRAPRGTIRWLREERLLFLRWMDTREVLMCSTMHKAFDGDTVTRRVKLAGKWTTISVPIPVAVKEYNKSMGGVDISDALISYYNTIHKTRKWYKTFFNHFVDIAVVNAFILHTFLAKSSQKKPLTQRAFREALVSELMASFTPRPSASTGPSPADASPVSHMPMHRCEDGTQGRCKCIHCHLKTPVFCSTCEVSLCFVPKRNCFNEWHTLKQSSKLKDKGSDRSGES